MEFILEKADILYACKVPPFLSSVTELFICGDAVNQTRQVEDRIFLIH